MNLFHRHSAFHDSLRPLDPPARLEEHPTHKEARNAPLEHWHHDLETVSILLEQDPPDLDRARRLLDDLRREIYAELR